MSRNKKTSPARPITQDRSAWAAMAILTVLALLVLLNSFLCDDAFISFRYADNLVHGQGLVFNIGERVEGYTNFLWVLLLAGVMKLGAAPETWSRGLALIFSLGTLGLFLAHVRTHGAGLVRYFFPLLLALSAPFYVWTSGGLETAAYAFFAFAGITTLLRARSGASTRKYQIASLCFVAAALTRPEGNLLFGLSLLYVAVLAMGRKVRWQHVLSFLLPFLLIGGAYFLWRWQYYGRFLPNTYYVKTPGSTLLAPGARYLGRFVYESWIWIPVLAVAYVLTRARTVSRDDRLVYLAAVVVAYAAYVVTTGGDFMVLSRFMVPMVAPILLLCHELVWSAHFGRKSWAPAWAMVAVVAVYGIGNGAVSYHAHGVWHTDYLDSIGLLDEYHHKWAQAGKALRLNSRPTDTVATSAAGCIPYYSHLYTIDMLGLIAPNLALYHHREDIARPGHSMVLDPKELLAMQPQFLLAHPRVEDSLVAVFPLTGLESIVSELQEEYSSSCLQLGARPAQFLNFWVRRDVAPRVKGLRVYK